jgi:hypothetical protein
VFAVRRGVSRVLAGPMKAYQIWNGSLSLETMTCAQFDFERSGNQGVRQHCPPSRGVADGAIDIGFENIIFHHPDTLIPTY